MKKYFLLPAGLFCLALCFQCKSSSEVLPDAGSFQLLSAKIGTKNLDLAKAENNQEIEINPNIDVEFSAVLDTSSAKSSIRILDDALANVPVSYRFSNENKTVSVGSTQDLQNGKSYSVAINSTLKGAGRESFPGYSVGFTTKPLSIKLDSMYIAGKKVIAGSKVVEVSQNPEIRFWFSSPVLESSLSASSLSFYSGSGSVAYSTTFSADKKSITLVPSTSLKGLSRYTIQLTANLKGSQGQSYGGSTHQFFTKAPSENVMPLISDEELMNKVQQQTLKYFYDFAHPVSGLAPERNTTPEVVTIGGSGFGVMALIVGVERGFITRQQGVDRWLKIVNFLKKADRFHGVWPHWMNGATGKTIPFSPNDDGGDLVESSFMIHGLITVRQYLQAANPTENLVRLKIDSLVNDVEWDWYRRGGQNVLYWHWSPRVGWQMNFPLRGWNETLIPYVLAASSTTHTIPKVVYTSGFASGSRYLNGQSYYGFPLALGEPFGGPLFFTHYSFLGLNPTNLSDQFANYWTLNQNHSKINHAYCVANPKKFVGYSADCWGLTASDNHEGYNAHSPTNDLGVITPTAALSSFPYTPTESMKALKFFYYKLGDRMWGDYGFYDAFNPTVDWYGRSYLAIDQGPIVVMMENYRTGLLWNLFMSAPEVQQGLTKLGFQY